MARRGSGTPPRGQNSPALHGHENAVHSAAFSPDGARVVTASDDRTARIWDATTGKELARIVLDAAVTGLAVHGGCFALGDWLGRIHVSDAQEFLSGEGGGGP